MSEPCVSLGVWQSCEDRAQSWEDECLKAEALLRRWTRRGNYDPNLLDDTAIFLHEIAEAEGEWQS